VHDRRSPLRVALFGCQYACCNTIVALALARVELEA
jgi:hypothetical protein